jgi:sugar-phosphatase
VVTADDVEGGKPDPAPFLTGAARWLGFLPGWCPVIAAPSGLASARTVGCPVVGVLTTHETLGAPTVSTLDRIDFRVVDGGIQVATPG